MESESVETDEVEPLEISGSEKISIIIVVAVSIVGVSLVLLKILHF